MAWNTINIKFETDGSSSDVGFECVFECVDSMSAAKRSLAEQALDQVEKRSLNEDLTCGGVVTLGQPGDRTRFTSHDGYDGSSQYGDFSFCNYKIRVGICIQIRRSICQLIFD